MNKVAILAALAVAGAASADTVKMAYLGTGNGRSITINGGGQWAGQLRFAMSEGPAGFSGNQVTFCTELAEQVGGTHYYNIEDLKDVPTNPGAMGEDAADAIRELYQVVAGEQFEANNNKAAAFQMVVWELAFDYDGTDSSKNLYGGNLNFSGSNGTVLGLAQGWLDSVDGSGPLASLVGLANNGKQDQIFLVPLPAPVGLGLAGLAGVAVIRRLRPR